MPRVSRRGVYVRKARRAAHLLFFKRHRKPGASASELKRALGPDYRKALEILDRQLRELDLRVREVEEPSVEGEGRSRFYITLRGTLTPTEAKYCGWRIDDLAGLAASILFITARGGKAPRKEVEALLEEKLPGWRVKAGLMRYIRAGYLGEDEQGNLYLDWRTWAEVDQKALVDLLMKHEE